MRRFLVFALLLVSSRASAQTYGWQGDQDGMGFICRDVAQFSALSGSSNGYTWDDDQTTRMYYTQALSVIHMAVNGSDVIDIADGLVVIPNVATPIQFGASGSLSGVIQVVRPVVSNDLQIIAASGGGNLSFIANGGVPLSTVATSGFVTTTSMPGIPTGSPVFLGGSSGQWAQVIDSTDERLYVRPDPLLGIPWLPIAQYTGGHGIGCVQTDNAGIQTVVACGSGSGITALTRDVTASGPGSATAEVTGITDVGSVDWQVTGSFANGKALGFVAGGLQAVSFQAPLVACTDYVSVSCQGGSSDIGTTGSNSAVPVIGIEDAGKARGYIDWTARTVPANPTGTVTREYNSLFGAGLITLDSSGNARYMAPNVTCSGANVATSIASGTLACGPASVACGGLPALVGSANSSAASCSTKVTAIDESGGLNIPIGACTTDGQAFVKVAGSMTCRLPGGDLSNDYTAPTVVGMHDNSGASWPVNGNFSNGNVLSMVAGKLVALPVAAQATKRDYTLNASLVAFVGTTWMLAGNSYAGSIGQVIEYPNDFKANTVQVSVNLPTNTIVSGTLTFIATLNGAAIAGTAINITSATATGVIIGSALPTGSSSSADTYGEAFQTSVGFAGGFDTVMPRIVLTP